MVNSLWCAYPYTEIVFPFTMGVVLSAQCQANDIPEIVVAIVVVAALGRAVVSVAMFVTVTVFAVVIVVVVVLTVASVDMWALFQDICTMD